MNYNKAWQKLYNRVKVERDESSRRGNEQEMAGYTSVRYHAEALAYQRVLRLMEEMEEGFE